MLLMVHANPARVEDGALYVDRKFHTGMKEYTTRLSTPIVSVHPHLPNAKDSTVMDLVRVPVAELGYEVRTTDEGYTPRRFSTKTEKELTALVARSRAVYGGGSLYAAFARRAAVPSIQFLEYNLRTMLVFGTKSHDPTWRKAYSGARTLGYYTREIVPTMRGATVLHCNGYPIYEEARWFNPNRLLYLDSRMGAALLISKERLESRLAERRKRPLKLIFSGRFEPGKGALDVVHTAKECAALGFVFSLDLYGQGSQREAMQQAVQGAGMSDFVKIHDVIPFPELVEKVKSSDLFVCCHVQDDPSCTYLETLGCGVPIAGYGNAMWKAMCADSHAGVVAPLGDTKELARTLIRLCRDANELDKLSLRAREFAEAHTFEAEFSRRTNSLLEIMERPRKAAAGASR